MIYYIALFLLIWSMIFSGIRFLQYYRIVRHYRKRAIAKVVSVTQHLELRKHEKKAVDVILEYDIDGTVGRSEVVIESKYSGNFALGQEIPIRYYVAPNGAVHVASENSAITKFMIAHGCAVLFELAAFIVIWIYM